MRPFVGFLMLLPLGFRGSGACSEFHEADLADIGPDAAGADASTAAETGADGSSAGVTRIVAHENARTAFVVTDTKSVYWWSQEHLEIRKIEKNAPGDIVTVIARPNQIVSALAADDAGLYWLEAGPDDSDGGGITSRIMTLSGNGTEGLLVRNSAEPLTLLTLDTLRVLATKAGGIIGALRSGGDIDSGFGIDGSGFGSDNTNAYYTYLGGIFRFTSGAQTSNVVAALSGPTEFKTEGQVLYGIMQSTGGGSALFRVDDSQSDQPSSAATVLTQISGGPLHLAIDNSGLVFVNGSDGTISRVGKSGGPQTNLVSGLNSPSSVAADAQGVYWTTDSGDVGWQAR